MFQIKFRPMKFLKDGRVIVSGPLALVGQPGLQCLSPHRSSFKICTSIFCGLAVLLPEILIVWITSLIGFVF